ncbi:putative two-component response regulator [Sulfurovum sp. enrichment culture clone C5]|uniref:Putative two-component response regulator n=1 Tax=Sulfurovum sp. enrichment culture clone C5 TaxID=497650 RepID=A0A0S4XNJ5_9BACT|nr:putative two-component response regulator [Sulfurovum sp. enrichment culture clone C5]
MKIIIVENELYLAQSIASKINQHGFEFEIHRSPKEAMESDGDVYLLSTNAPNETLHSFIQKYKNKIIILMVNYINNDTVGEPIKLGAIDYILKPFRIEELFRKIEHYQEFQKLKKQVSFFNDYMESKFRSIESENIEKIVSKQSVIITNNQVISDRMAFDYAKNNNYNLIFFSLQNNNWKQKIEQKENDIFYINDFDSLKKSEKENALNEISKLNFILVSSNDLEVDYQKITILSKNKIGCQSDILTIDEYTQQMIVDFQGKYPDTELSKKLGMSRKSLWEKRKKYDIYKKK